MAETPKIEVKPGELTEAEKAAQKFPEKTSEQLKKEQEEVERQTREKEAIKVLDETKTNTRADLLVAKGDIPPEQLAADRPTIEKTLGLKIQEAPKTVPAYLDLIAETHSESLREKWFMLFLSWEIQKLLHRVSHEPTLSRDRDFMNQLKNSINRIIIDKNLIKEIEKYGTMDGDLREKLKTELGISDKISEWLDENTRDIIQKVHTGFYRYDAGANTWVNSLGAIVFLWPENIAGIEKYLKAKLVPSLEKYKKDHPEKSEENFYKEEENKQFLYLTRKDDHGIGGQKYAIDWDGRPHNMMLAEADYLTQYLQKRGEGKDDVAVFSELGLTHVANLTDNEAVQKSVKEFEEKYSEGSFNAPASVQLSSQSEKISKNVLPAKIPEYTRITNLVELERYEHIVDNQRPEMKDIIYDIAAGFVRFDESNNVFQTVSGMKLDFSSSELTMVQEIFWDTRVRPEALFVRRIKEKNIQPNNDRLKVQYDNTIFRDRIHFYQQ